MCVETEKGEIVSVRELSKKEGGGLLKWLNPRWIRTDYEYTYAGKIVYIEQSYYIIFEDRRKDGVLITLENNGHFRKLHVFGIDSDEAKALLLNKNVKIVIKGYTEKWKDNNEIFSSSTDDIYLSDVIRRSERNEA